jgi:hypothetical protein
VFVNISPAETIAQDWQSEPARRGWRAIGETYFLPYKEKPKAHRVSNSDRSNYRVTDTEILRSCGTPADLDDVTNQTLIVENPRVLVTRIVLHPGESTELLGHCAMLVAVSPGEVSIGSGGQIKKQSMDRAAFQWRESSERRTLTNVGGTVFHAVDIRIK